jgi:hypothetical protein
VAGGGADRAQRRRAGRDDLPLEHLRGVRGREDLGFHRRAGALPRARDRRPAIQSSPMMTPASTAQPALWPKAKPAWDAAVAG